MAISTFGFGDIGAPLEKIRRQRSVQTGWLGGKRTLGNVEIGSGLAGENCDGVLKLFALLAEQSCLRARGVEERFFLSDVQAGSDAAFVARVDEIEPLLECFHGAPEKSDLRIELAQGEIVGGEFRGKDEANILEIGGVGLKRGLCRFNGTAALADEVHFVAHREGQPIIVLRDGSRKWSVGAGWARPRVTLALGGGID